MSDAVAQSGTTVPLSVYEAAKSDMLKWKGKARDEMKKRETAEAERDEATKSLATLTKERDALTKERDDLKNAPAAEPDDKDKTIAELTGQIRSRDHREAMKGMLKDANLRDDALDALLTIGKYDPEKYQSADGKPDAVKIKTFLEEARTANPWAVAPAESGGTAPVGAASATLTNGKPAGPGVTRGVTPPVPPSDQRTAAIERVQSVTGHRDPGRIA